MERAPLRPVPPRPEGPVEPDAATRHVAERLPALDSTAATALALVEVAGRPRAEAAEHTGLSAEELAVALVRARKALRRSVASLPGSGWCERAERLISDQLDGELEPPDPRRLEVHLDNCPRCVEHELRLAQATEVLMRAFVETVPAPAAIEAPAPELTVVPPATEEPEPAVADEAAPIPTAPRVSGQVGQRMVAFAWHALFALAVLLAVATIAVVVIGVLGGQL